VTIKILLLILFLCVCLVWVGAAYLHPGPEFREFGLLWTAVVLMAFLVLVIGARLFGWWRLWRAKAAVRPVAPTKPAPMVHEDDAALAALIAEANAALAKAPSYSGARGKTPLSGLPLYLLIGPVGAGKTSTFLNSGVEPQLLAGQTSGTAGSTRLCNLWLAKNAVFAEFSGRVFAGDIGRWSALLGVLRGKASIPLWRRLWREPEAGLTLRGVIGFSDVKELTGAAADPQRLEGACREWQERLRAVSEVFGMEFPVYQVFTKCDKIPFFSDYFGRLPESEVNQVLGCTLPIGKPDPSRPGEVFAEVEAKRLTGAFRPLYHSLAERRITHLAHEPNPARKPGIYEFPRELKRIRGPLVQFLTDVFRPHPLRPVPRLRGFYLTAVQEVEVAAAKPVPSEADWTSPNLGLEATRLFRGDATQIFNPDDQPRATNVGGRKGVGIRWIFASDLFHQIVLGDRPLQTTVPKDVHLQRYRRGAFSAVCGLCALLCFAFVTSWGQNHYLLRDVAEAGNATVTKRGNLTTADLQSLERLRVQVEGLQNGKSLSYHWGLYSGDEILDAARNAYFRRFQQLLLNDLNEVMLGQLRNLPSTPSPNDPDEPAYDLLKTHLTISSGTCKSDPEFVSRVLKGVRRQLAPEADPEWQALADRQIAFYAAALGRGNPCKLREDDAVRDHARQYLQGIKGVERIYRRILADAEKTLAKPQRLEDLAPNYKQVLNSKAEVSPAFTQQGWSFVQNASKKDGNTPALGESCVIGGLGLVSELKQDVAVESAIQQFFIRDYIAQWQAFIAGFSVVPYRSATDAAQKLNILADHKSPLLALLAMTANQTNFPVSAEPSALEKVPFLGEAFKKGEKTAQQKLAAIQADSPSKLSTADITRSFQPVHWVVPPGSETWVLDKNGAYIAALTQLGHSMQDIATGANSDPAVYQNASQNFQKAMDAARQIASGFKPVGVGGLDVEVERLLAEPIQFAQRLIPADVSKVGADKINGALRNLCVRMKNTLRKYPFQPKSSDDANLDELAGLFAPVNGAIWKFSGESLGELAVKEGSQWKLKDPAKKPQITQEMLSFLNHAQAIADAFFPAGATQARLSYTLRPSLDSAFGDSKFELEIDGTRHVWESALQKNFTWPSPNAANQGAIARIRGKFSYAFANRGGLWGIFRIMGDAEPRALLGKTVEWKYSQVGDGRKDLIEPAPVRLEIVQFPGGADVFNPRFYDGLQCPPRAVQ